MNKRLFELLHKLPQPMQDKITSLAKKDSDHFCERYGLALPEQKDTAYRYYLSKRVRFAWFSSMNFEHADPVDIVDIGKIRDDYHERLGWLLNDDIQSKAPYRSALLKEELIQPLEESVL